LLSRVRDPSDDGAWREFDAKYRELILRYCRARGLQTSDAEDVRQIAMVNLAKSLRSFEYKPARGRFRGYLGQVVRSAISRHFARPNAQAKALDTHVLVTVVADDAGQADEVWECEWVRHHYRLAMQSVRTSFDPKSVQMFDRLLAGDDVSRVATDFQTTSQAVHKVKQRIRDRLKELIAAQVREEDDDGSATAPL
jgi:RNA polymerase sigma factor (sigma-70 family)